MGKKNIRLYYTEKKKKIRMEKANTTDPCWDSEEV